MCHVRARRPSQVRMQVGARRNATHARTPAGTGAYVGGRPQKCTTCAHAGRDMCVCKWLPAGVQHVHVRIQVAARSKATHARTPGKLDALRFQGTTKGLRLCMYIQTGVPNQIQRVCAHAGHRRCVCRWQPAEMQHVRTPVGLHRCVCE